MSCKKIIYLARTDIHPYIGKSIFLNKIKKSDWNFEVWDLSKFFKNTEMVSLSDKVIKVVDINSIRSLLEQQDPNVVFIPLFTIELETYWVFRLLRKYRKISVRIDTGMIPSSIRNSSIDRWKDRALSMRLDVFSIRRVVKRFLISILNLAYGTNDYIYDLVFISSQNLSNRYHDDSVFVKINSLDYDTYQEFNKNYIKHPKKYVVFLDENAPHHPDSKLFNQLTVNSDKYYKGLNTFFDFLQSKFNIEVVIAMHPTSSNNLHKYNQRVFYGNTEELVRGSEFVVSHSSTSISYAILHNKPIMTIFNNEVKEFGHRANYHMICSFAKAVSANMYNVDDYISFKDITLPVSNLNAYHDYKYTYLTSKETENRISGDIFIKSLDELHSTVLTQ